MTAVLPRANLNEQVYDTLKRRLVRRDLRAGEKVSLHELASELGVSRSPVHHALTRLVSEGLLSVKARRGYYVTPVTAKVLLDAYDVRLALELCAAEQTVGRLSAGQLAELTRLLEATCASLDGTRFRDRDGFDATNAAFHEYQIDLAGNHLISAFYRELPVMLLMQVIRGGRADAGADLAGEHRRIVEAYAAGDLAAAQAAIRAHIDTGKRLSSEALELAGGMV
jgi:DNA-binding GntR family transcriptional regulator